MSITFEGFDDDGIYFLISGQLAQELAVRCGAGYGWEPAHQRCTVLVTIHREVLTNGRKEGEFKGQGGASLGTASAEAGLPGPGQEGQGSLWAETPDLQPSSEGDS